MNFKVEILNIFTNLKVRIEKRRQLFGLFERARPETGLA